MSKLNGQYGIIDESDSNRTIISLKLTPAAAEKIKKFIEYKGTGSKACINFTAQDDVVTEVKSLRIPQLYAFWRKCGQNRSFD